MLQTAHNVQNGNGIIGSLRDDNVLFCMAHEKMMLLVLKVVGFIGIGYVDVDY